MKHCKKWTFNCLSPQANNDDTMKADDVLMESNDNAETKDDIFNEDNPNTNTSAEQSSNENGIQHQLTRTQSKAEGDSGDVDIETLNDLPFILSEKQHNNDGQFIDQNSNNNDIMMLNGDSDGITVENKLNEEDFDEDMDIIDNVE